MGKRVQANESEVLEALGDAVTRAIHWAPEGLLIRVSDDKSRERACRRLAIRVVTELAGDGWTEGRCERDSEGLHAALAVGLERVGAALLRVLSQARRCGGKLLEGIGLHIASVVLAAMNADGARLKRMRGFHSPASQSVCSRVLA